MTNNRDKTITDLPKDIFTNAMSQANLPDKEVNAICNSLFNSTKRFHRMFQEDITKQAAITLFQAIIDDDCNTVKRILDSKPDLLLIDSPKNLVIESKWTWQKIYAEKAAIMAAKRKQIKMLELILSYYNHLRTDEAKEAKAKAISAWKIYATKKNAAGEDEIIIPSEYTEYAKSLIDVFRKETFPNGFENRDYGMLSEETESALSTLFNRLLPEQAVRLDDDLDVELLLLAVYKTSVQDLNAFNNWEQQHTFCVRVIGLIQSVLSPEAAKSFCAGLYDIVTAMQKGEKNEISKDAASHILKFGESFYRTSRDSKEGAGFHFFSGIYGHTSSDMEGLKITLAVWNSYIAQKQQICVTYEEALKTENGCMCNRGRSQA